MTLRELWELFPIILSRHEDHWKQWAAEEISTLENALGRNAKRISHIGSTAVERICAKPIVDILLEVADGVSCDNDEMLLRDYLNSHPNIAHEYGSLKIELQKRFKHDRDGYTNAKTDFITRHTRQAKLENPPHPAE